MVGAYWEIGRQITEAVGERAEYGRSLLAYLSERLTEEFGKGFTERNLRAMRQFYEAFPIRHTLRAELSWSHYRLLMRVKEPNRRAFYLTESADSGWTSRQLERQINSFFYERLLATQKESRAEVAGEVFALEPKTEADYILKDPYILEFLDLKENAKYSESEMEQGLIDKLQEFLLELGKGFSFVARQKRITTEHGEHYYIDLKADKLTYQDVGQIDFYVRLFDEKIKREDDNPTIGIVLVTDKDESIAKYSVLADNEKLFASKYRLLSFEEPTRFIFSHSALREGWDNPNVFQICTLKHSDNATAKRQEVGRGLRLCVNSLGERQDLEVCGETLVQGVNMLTVVASESYDGFVADLQREIKSDLYERPTAASVDYFANRTVYLTDDQPHTFTVAEATAVYNYLVRNDYVDDNGGVTDTYRAVAETGNFAPMKPEIAPFAESVHKLVQGIFDPSILKDMAGNGHETKVKDNPLNENWAAFKDLWERINKRYAYTVEFDGDELIRKSIAAIDIELKVARLSYTLTKGS